MKSSNMKLKLKKKHFLPWLIGFIMIVLIELAFDGSNVFSLTQRVFDKNDIWQNILTVGGVLAVLDIFPLVAGKRINLKERTIGRLIVFSLIATIVFFCAQKVLAFDIMYPQFSDFSDESYVSEDYLNDEEEDTIELPVTENTKRFLMTVNIFQGCLPVFTAIFGFALSENLRIKKLEIDNENRFMENNFYQNVYCIYDNAIGAANADLLWQNEFTSKVGELIEYRNAMLEKSRELFIKTCNVQGSSDIIMDELHKQLKSSRDEAEETADAILKILKKKRNKQSGGDESKAQTDKAEAEAVSAADAPEKKSSGFSSAQNIIYKEQKDEQSADEENERYAELAEWVDDDDD